MNDIIVLIPAFEPDAALATVARSLHERGLPCLVVDDGSGPAYAEIFRQAEAWATVVGYEKNRGKGGALKYGMEYIRRELPEVRFFVTADADGQHATADILRVAEKIRETGGIVLGSRAFTGKVPFRSRAGNGLSRCVYAIACSLYLQDNQTGLRAFETAYIPWLISIPGRFYDWEINVLMYAAKRNVPIHETMIQTIYIGENTTSHFRTVVDTLRLHGKILRSSVPSLLSFVIQIASFILFYNRLLPWKFAPDAALWIAGGIGIFFSFLLNTCAFATRTGVPFRLSWRKLLVSIFRLAAYQFVLWLCVHFFRLSVPLALTLAVLLVVVMEYFLLKFIVAIQDRRPSNLRTKNL